MAFLNSCDDISWEELYCGALGFLLSKVFGLCWCALFFWDPFFYRLFHVSGKSNWSGDFSHAEIVKVTKNWVNLRRDFQITLKVEWEIGVWTIFRFLRGNFFRVLQFEFYFQCSSLECFNMIHICSICGFLPLYDFINMQLMLVITPTQLVVKISLIVFCPLFQILSLV